MGVRGIAFVVAGLCIPWILFSHLARREYVATIRKRLAARRLDFESIRFTVQEPATIRLLETAALKGTPRQAAYALGLLADVPRYNMRPLLEELAASPACEVRAELYEIAGRLHFDGLLKNAMDDVRAAQSGEPSLAARQAARYALEVALDRARLATALLNDSQPVLVEAALDVLHTHPTLAHALITSQWLQQMAQSPDPRLRTLAGRALAMRGNVNPAELRPLFEDPEAEVAAAACRAAGELRDPDYIPTLVEALGNARLRRDAITALAGFGPQICATLGSLIHDENVSLRIRCQIPRVLKNIPDQQSVDVLMPAIPYPDLMMRAAVLKALNRLRESAPSLNFDHIFVTEQILAEARYYFELNAALSPVHEYQEGNHRAARLLARTMEERLHETLERLFRLLGLRYPPKEIYSAYLAVAKRPGTDTTAALEFLDSVLERDLKRILLPLLDAPEHLLERGRALFGVEVPTAEEAVRELIRSQDPWLVACAMAAAAELHMRSLADDIADVAKEAAEEVTQVAHFATAALAA